MASQLRENVCLFLSVSLPPSLPLSFCSCGCAEASDIVAPVFTTCRSVCAAEALLCVPFALVILHVKALDGGAFSERAHSPSTLHSVFFFFCCFFDCLFLTCTQRHLVGLTTFSLAASLAYLSDSRVFKSSLEVRCVRLARVCVGPKRRRRVFTSLRGSPECSLCRLAI